MLVLFRFVDDQLDNDEIAIENRFDLLMLDKLIEPFAPPSPGSAEIHKYAFPVLTCLLPRLSQQLIRTRGCQRHSKCG